MDDDLSVGDNPPPEFPPIDASEVWAAPATVGGALGMTWRLITARPELMGMIGVNILLAWAVAWVHSGQVMPKMGEGFHPLQAILSGFGWLDLLNTFILGPILNSMLLLTVEVVHSQGEFHLGAVVARAVRRAPLLFLTTWLTAIVSLPGLVLCIVPGLFITAYLSLASARTVLDDVGPISALRWSWNQPEAIGGLLVRLLFASFGIMALFLIPMSMMGMMARPWEHPETPLPYYRSAQIVFGVLMNCLADYFTIAYCWVYLERRAGRLPAS